VEGPCVGTSVAADLDGHSLLQLTTCASALYMTTFDFVSNLSSEITIPLMPVIGNSFVRQHPVKVDFVPLPSGPLFCSVYSFSSVPEAQGYRLDCGNHIGNRNQIASNLPYVFGVDYAVVNRSGNVTLTGALLYADSNGGLFIALRRFDKDDSGLTLNPDSILPSFYTSLPTLLINSSETLIDAIVAVDPMTGNATCILATYVDNSSFTRPGFRVLCYVLSSDRVQNILTYNYSLLGFGNFMTYKSSTVLFSKNGRQVC
jgi:hypothetical protein